MLYKRADGLVIIDPEKAKGHPEIVDTCPYGAIFWSEEAVSVNLGTVFLERAG